MVALNPMPFQEGTLRVIFKMMDYSMPIGQQECVGKLSKDPNENPRAYFKDVEMQGKAKYFAEMYNAQRPPKTIDYVVPYIIEFKKRPARNGMGPLVLGVEPMLTGQYKKHSNNFGFVSSEDRNTPAAFSHYTYHVSGGKLMVVDIQGVDDTYTDPQIHTADGAHKYGKADMGPQGIQKFFSTHLCNAICQYLKLPQVGGKKRIDFEKALKGGEDPLQFGGVPAAPMIGSPLMGLHLNNLTPISPVTPVAGMPAPMMSPLGGFPAGGIHRLASPQLVLASGPKF